ncbi:hypothetical protein [Vibrio sonorensis]|uniref:hypothetical protein n=1 Tax=Vibrio sonorensis TaxID=1004316 RepID=UPI0008D98FA4|nr:hypothetical protein [Vibrio sonorensis]
MRWLVLLSLFFSFYNYGSAILPNHKKEYLGCVWEIPRAFERRTDNMGYFSIEDRYNNMSVNFFEDSSGPFYLFEEAIVNRMNLEGEIKYYSLSLINKPDISSLFFFREKYGQEKVSIGLGTGKLNYVDIQDGNITVGIGSNNVLIKAHCF